MAYTYDLPSTARRLVKDSPPTFRLTEQGAEASDKWYVPLADLTVFLRTVGGKAEMIGGGLYRVVPLRFHDYPICLATDAGVTWVGWSGSYFTGAKVSISYRTPNWAEDFLSVSTSPDNRTLPKPASTALGMTDVPVGGTNYSLTFHKLASAPLNTWRAYGGYCNSVAWRGFDAETVLYLGPQTQQSTALNGVTTYDVTQQFRVSRVSWRQAYDATGSLYDTGVPPTVDFASVFA